MPNPEPADRPLIVWFRQDLRLADNPALSAAAESGRPVLPLYVFDEEAGEPWRPALPSRWWLGESLAALARDLAELGAPLMLRAGAADAIVPELARRIHAAGVFWNRCYEPSATARDAEVADRLAASGVPVREFNSALLREPREVVTARGRHFTAFAPFWHAWHKLAPIPSPLPRPQRLRAPGPSPESDRLEDLGIAPKGWDRAETLREIWRPGEQGANRRLDDFLEHRLPGYARNRDHPGREATSRLSPHLRWGEIGPRQIWHALEARAHAGGQSLSDDVRAFADELGWREFSYHLLFHVPTLPLEHMRVRFGYFPWTEDRAALRAWREGRTGYPIVDAGMRELAATGWMHNRVRMIAASFLAKHLMIDWREGARWFWDSLVDADLANNSVNWQWVAGTGANAPFYTRMFNPVMQGRKFDPDGRYVRRWVPELAKLPDSFIHCPWRATPSALHGAGVRLGATYPAPIVEHDRARKRAHAAAKVLLG